MKDTLHILFTESSTGWGGQENHTLSESRGLLDRGHRVTLLSDPQATIIPAAERLGIPTVTLPIGRKNLRAFTALRRWLKTHGTQFDVINTNSSTDSWLTALAVHTLADMPPLVRTRHVSTPVNNNPATHWLYRHATAYIVTTGEAIRQQLHRDNGYPLDRMESVPTGIDLDRFVPADSATMRRKLGLPEAPTIGIVATLRDWKGHDYLLEAYALLRPHFQSWQLLIVGDGPRRAHLETRIVELALTEHVRMVGNQDNVPEWLGAMDVFALPSYGNEGLPQAIMQAMACALPVVTTPIGAIGEAVRDDETGIMVQPRDAISLADGLARLMADEELRLRLSDAGRRHALANFGIVKMLDRMEEIFRRFTTHRHS